MDSVVSMSFPILLQICLSILSLTLPTTTESACSKGGQLVSSFKRFPHHVTIETDAMAKYRICGGSIVNDRWILTSAFCIENSGQLRLHFEKLYYYSNNGSFTIVVNKDEIQMHPTYAYDIALIHLPIRLLFSESLKKIEISSSPLNQLAGRFAVLTGFDTCRQPVITTSTTTTTTTTPRTTTTSTPETTTTTTTSGTEVTWDWDSTQSPSTDDTENTPSSTESVTTVADFIPSERQLIYGMFRILSNEKCLASEKDFDEFQQICSDSWIVNSGDNNPCWSHGSGLVTGWPANLQLVGVRSFLLNNCSSVKPAVYTSVAKFLPWIESVIYDYDINP